jgi:hypothetical protein
VASDDLTGATPRFVYRESLWCEAPSFLWYCIPKNASRSLVRMLTAKGGRRISDIAPDVEPRAWVRATPRPALRFAFVRDPYQRLISAWRNKVGAPTQNAKGSARLFALNPGLQPGASLDDFVDWLGRNYAAHGPDKHWRRQCDYICDETGALCVDVIGTVETLAADMARLGEALGPFELIAHTNKSRRTPDEPAPAMSDRARAIVQDIYREDFERFGYRM